MKKSSFFLTRSLHNLMLNHNCTKSIVETSTASMAAIDPPVAPEELPATLAAVWRSTAGSSHASTSETRI